MRGAAVRTRWPRPQLPPAVAAAEAQPAAGRKPEKDRAQLALPLKAFKARLASGSPLAATAKAFKSYAETCASLLRLCREAAIGNAAARASSSSYSPSDLPLALSLHAHAVRSGIAADRSVASHLLTAYAAFARAAERDRVFADCVAAGAASSFTYDFMVSAYVKAGDVASARRLFDAMPERSVVSYMWRPEP